MDASAFEGRPEVVRPVSAASLAQQVNGSRPDFMGRVVDHIDANLGEPLCVADLSQVAGVSGSTLSRAFRKHFACGPMAFAKQRRLAQARRDLIDAAPRAATVTEGAMTYGFYHLAQFATDYRKAFGGRPSETLRRD